MDFVSSVNALYRYDAVIDGAKGAFKAAKPQVLLLTDFLVKPVHDALVNEVGKIRGREVYTPHEFRFEELILSKTINDFFSSLQFKQFVSNLTGTKIKNISLEAKRFGHEDFSLMYDDAESGERFVFFYLITDGNWKSEWGGATIFSFGDKRAPTVFEVKSNSLAIMKVPKGMRDFVKYVNHFAGKNSFVKISGLAL